MEIAGHSIESISAVLLFGTFLLAGVVKVALPPSTMQKDFPTLPLWFWKWVGAWELTCSLLYAADYQVPALYLSAVMMGGIFYSLFCLKGQDGKTIAVRTFGMGLIPVRLYVSHLL